MKNRVTLDLSDADLALLNRLKNELELSKKFTLIGGLYAIKHLRDDDCQLVKPDGTKIHLVGVSK